MTVGPSAIEAMFARCRKEKRAAFIPYITAGDPDLETTGKLMRALVDGGADLIELGVPFSDPIADGPTNQRAAGRALAAGTKLAGILDLVSRYRDRLGVPILLFSYYNPLQIHGIDRFAERAAASGVDGVLCLDLPPEEAAREFVPTLNGHGIDTVFLLAPTSTKERIKLAGKLSSGFVYYVSRTGVTGAEGALPEELLGEIKAVKRQLKKPLAVGFGITTPQQVATLAKVADGIVVGSALVRLVEEYGGDRRLPLILEGRVAELTAPLHKKGWLRRRG